MSDNLTIIQVNNIIDINKSMLLVNEFIIKMGYKIDQIYIDKLWDSIKDKKWLYINNNMLIWIGYINEEVRHNKRNYIKLLTEKFKENNDFKQLNSIEFKEFYVIHKNHIETNTDEINDHNKVKHLLVSPRCFKESLMLLGTPKAQLIRKYYLDLEEVFHLYINYQNEYQNQLLEFKNKEIENIHYQNKINHHNILIEKFKYKKCLYIMEIDEIHLKIGTSDRINERFGEVKTNYKLKSCFYLDMFEAYDYKQIETFIKNNKDIKKNLINKYNGVSTTEMVKLTDSFNYNQFITIVKKCINDERFLTEGRKLEKLKINSENEKREFELKKLKLESDKLKFENREKERQFELEKLKYLFNLNNSSLLNNIELINEINNLKNEIDKLSNNNNNIINKNIELKQKINDTENQDLSKIIQYYKNTPSKGKRIQKIDPNNLTVVLEVFDCMNALIYSPNGNLYNEKSIRDCALKNKLFKGFRWNIIDRLADPFICKDLPPTIETKDFSIKPIIKLDETKTKIIKVYSTKEECIIDSNINLYRLNACIKENKLYLDHYYVNNCDENLLKEYNINLNDYKYVPSNAKQFIKIHPITKEEEVFNTISDIKQKYGFHGNYIKKAIEKNTLYKDYYWKLA